MEKLNYLVGMCYPSYTPEERMITPLISLTMGDMFDRVTGLLGSLTVTVEDASTWEINDGLQFPHFIKAACEFKYIGNDKLSTSSTRNYNGLAYKIPQRVEPAAISDIRRVPINMDIEPVASPFLPLALPGIRASDEPNVT